MIQAICTYLDAKIVFKISCSFYHFKMPKNSFNCHINKYKSTKKMIKITQMAIFKRFALRFVFENHLIDFQSNYAML